MPHLKRNAENIIHNILKQNKTSWKKKKLESVTHDKHDSEVMLDKQKRSVWTLKGNGSWDCLS